MAAVLRFRGANEHGHHVGEDHERAKLTDSDVECMIRMHQLGYGYRRLAGIFECSKSQVKRIVTQMQRAQRPVQWRRWEARA